MPIIDRYIVVVFLKIFLICFASFSGLFIIIDAFTNLEEFLDLGKSGDIVEVVAGYYGPRILQFFDKTAAMIALVAAIFSLALMQRNNELTAIAAAGVSRRRIVKPILVATIVIVLLTVVNRETLIPGFRQNLAMNAQDLAKGKGRSFGLTVDNTTGIVIRGKQVMPAEQMIDSPVFMLPPKLADTSTRVTAEEGLYLPANADHPGGFLLSKVANVDTPDETRSQQVDGATVIYRPADTDWLESDQMFVVTEIDTLQLAFSRELTRYAPLSEMIANSRRPSSSFSNRHRVDIHARIVQPFFDMTILLIGLPLVIARGQRSLFLAAGVCLVVVVLMVLVVIASHSMGAARIISPPSFAAWLPLIIFLPVAAVTFHLLDR